MKCPLCACEKLHVSVKLRTYWLYRCKHCHHTFPVFPTDRCSYCNEAMKDDEARRQDSLGRFYHHTAKQPCYEKWKETCFD